jgi:hypothetical protein
MGAHPGTVRGRRGKDGGWAPMGSVGSGGAPACRVKGCERLHFVGGLCGFHALTEYYRRSPKANPGAPSRALARIRLLRVTI